MPANLTPAELKELTDRLRAREAQLRSELQSGEARASSETFERLASEAPDRGDASFAQLVTDSVNAERQRDSDEQREVVAALERIQAGTYGLCMTCGEPIGIERLRAQPTARYDLRHERENEQRAGGVATPRL
jgi:RNA polymerase-binding transcription factor DksA